MTGTAKITEKYDDLFTLRWYRDRDRGQEAADAMQADQIQDGAWPIAVLICESEADADTKWKQLLSVWKVNAMMYHPIVRAGLPIKAS